MVLFSVSAIFRRQKHYTHSGFPYLLALTLGKHAVLIGHSVKDLSLHIVLH